MATDVKLESRIVAAVARALEPFADEMFRNLGRHYTLVGEVRVSSRTEPDDSEVREGDEARNVVKLRVEHLELARSEEDDARLRDILRLFYEERTTDGTLDSEAARPDPEGDADREARLRVIR